MTAVIPWHLFRDLPAPRHPDPLVFGPPPPERDPYAYAGPEQRCPVHQVTWRGDGPCWACNTETND